MEHLRRLTIFTECLQTHILYTIYTLYIQIELLSSLIRFDIPNPCKFSLVMVRAHVRSKQFSLDMTINISDEYVFNGKENQASTKKLKNVAFMVVGIRLYLTYTLLVPGELSLVRIY